MFYLFVMVDDNFWPLVTLRTFFVHLILSVLDLIIVELKHP